jgi:hypothetical protein
MHNLHFAYHLKPDDFQGSEILPLSLLEKMHPELAKTAIQKYNGREKLINRVVYNPGNSPHKFMGDQILTWTDVSFCSMIDPNLVFKKLKELGFISKEIKTQAFKIPLELFPTKTIVWLGQKEMEKANAIRQDDYCSLEDAYNQIDISVLPQKTIEYFESFEHQGKRPLFFVHMPHILCAEPIDISMCEIIEVA